MSQEIHISSLVVQSQPQHLADVAASIEGVDDASIFGRDESGKLVVVLETHNSQTINDRLTQFNSLPGVYNVSLVYHQVENPVHLDEVQP